MLVLGRHNDIWQKSETASHSLSERFGWEFQTALNIGIPLLKAKIAFKLL